MNNLVWCRLKCHQPVQQASTCSTGLSEVYCFYCGLWYKRISICLFVRGFTSMRYINRLFTYFFYLLTYFVHAGILMKQLNMSSDFFTVGYPHHSSFYLISTLTRDIDIAILFVRLSICLSGHPTRSGILLKQLNIFSQFFHHSVAQSFWFYEYQTHPGHLQQGYKIQEIKFFMIFDQQVAASCILQTIRDSAMVTMEH